MHTCILNMHFNNNKKIRKYKLNNYNIIIFCDFKLRSLQDFVSQG